MNSPWGARSLGARNMGRRDFLSAGLKTAAGAAVAGPLLAA